MVTPSTTPTSPWNASDEAQRQVCNARNQLTAWGFPQTSFAYPYATVNASVETIVKNCGYNSARGLGDVQPKVGGTPGLYAETVPPADAYALRAPDEVDSTWTLTDLQNTVLNAENNGGGWDILTFHHLVQPGQRELRSDRLHHPGAVRAVHHVVGRAPRWPRRPPPSRR